ncbi:MAG: YccF domain-containing protein [Armatimonadetes bacterium]|nr:YccF domain-containing protein [Armatimonadota bacterium]
MTILGNIVWLVFGGFTASLALIVAGASLCITIIGIPFGLQSIKIGIAMLTPFGKEIVADEEHGGLLRLVFNGVWLIFFGWAMALNHLVFALVLGLTIVGIPFARQHLKLLSLSLFPFGKELR